MHIVFNSLIAGLGNNGGSRTIFKCAEVLRNLGHKVGVCAREDNFTWFKHEATLKYIPEEADVIINSSCHDMPSTMSSKISKKFWYIRAHEAWAMDESKLVSYYLNTDVKNIVNSIGLQQQLKSYGAESLVVYQGIDFDWWSDLNIRTNNYKTRIGCLYSTKPRKRWKDFVELSEILGRDDFEYVAMGDEVCNDIFISEFEHKPDKLALTALYSSCDIWFAPTDSEGLHNVPLEANLCGALVVCSNHTLNGMIHDYAFTDTAMIYDGYNIEHAATLIKNPNYACVNNMQEVIINTINTREYNMKKLVNILEAT